MKKTLFFFFTLFFLFFPIHVNAQAMPSISSPTYSVIDGGQTDLINGNLINYGLFPFQEDSFKYILQTVLGSNPYLQPSDFTIRPLTDIERENLEEGFTRHFYNENGDEIPLSDLYYVSGDNGYLHSEFYMDSNGNVLYGDLDKTNTLMNFGFSHGAFNPDSNYANWDAVYSDVAERIEQGNFNYYPGEIPSGSNTYFTWVGYGGSKGPIMAGYILIPNQNIPGQIVPLNRESDGTIYQWYTNDLNLISSVTTLGNYQPTTVKTGNYSYNGYSYRYLVSGFANINGIPDSRLINYDDWANGNVKGDFIFGRQGTYYNELVSPEDSIGFKKVRTPEIPIISPDELYNYDELAQTVPEAIPEANPQFDPSAPIAPGNYPINYPSPAGVVIPSNLPLPGSQPGINPQPLPSGDIITIDPSELPDNIPFVSNLQSRFPFSIPWDIKRMLTTLRSNAVAPCFEISWYIRPLDYTWEFALDLSSFDQQAQLFRILFLISFIVGLAIFSYDHFFGS